ncbi:MAG: MaoC family dehydratase N-terminal domain-containing protein [Candidatus Rokubacteria bacterium]|nr:MaoC family dehydratase N-terminal domain-containing protein [Candidatus Rokubacteria bacterium]
MTIPSKIVGTEIGAVSQTIDARWLMAYAAALGEEDPRYYDTTRAGGPVAHPLFPVGYEWTAALNLRAKTIRAELHPHGVHASHHTVIHRVPQAGDRLLTRAQVIAVRPTRAGTLVVSRFSTVNRNGQPVTTTDYGSVYRGVSTESETRAAVEPLPRPAAPAVGKPRWTASVAVSLQVAHVYTECARIWNPIHTDLAVARAAGLPGLILHGTATLALAVSQVIRRELGGDPLRVREVAARFAGMVALPSTLGVRCRGREGPVVAFDAVDARGEPVLRDGVVRAAA